MGTDDHNLKIYTLSIPPSTEDPYLHPIRHSRIIKRFDNGLNACHTINSLGEVDFYLLMPLEEDFDEFPEKTEDFGLKVSKAHNLILISLYYDDELFGEFSFDLDNQLDTQCIRFLVNEKRVNFYFICALDKYYVCYGFKTVNLPRVLTYDLSRHLTGQEPLMLPQFSQELYSDEFISKEMLLSNAWGFYLDYTSLLAKVGNNEDAEEIMSLYILSAMARIQKSRRKIITEDRLILWVGRRLGLDSQEQPKEFLIIYLSGTSLTGNPKKDVVVKIVEEALKDSTEYCGAKWVSPLAQEAIPLATILQRNIYRLELNERFYSLSRQLFTEYCKPAEGYKSHYDRLFMLQQENSGGKIYNLWIKRWERGYDDDGQLPLADIEKLIEGGQEQDLTRIFMLLAKVPEEELDELIVKICEVYQDKAEPYLLAGLQASSTILQEAALLGLGIMGSTQAIPGLLRLLRQGSKAQNIWDTFLMIGDPAVHALASLLKDNTPQLKQKAMETLTLLGSSRAREIISMEQQ